MSTFIRPILKSRLHLHPRRILSQAQSRCAVTFPKNLIAFPTDGAQGGKSERDERDELLAIKDDLLAIKDELLATKDRILANHEEQLALRDELLTIKEHQLAMRDKLIQAYKIMPEHGVFSDD